MILSSHQMSVVDAIAMENLGRALYQCSNEGLVIFLQGDLGAGKTTLVRGFLRAMHYLGVVKSPTYTLVEPYELNDKKVYHFDFYRLSAPKELEYTAIGEYFQSDAYCLIEWPEKATGWLPTSDLTVNIEIIETFRIVNIEAYSEKGKDVLQKLKM